MRLILSTVGYLLVGAAARDRSAVLFGIPARNGVCIALVEQQPLFLISRRWTPVAMCGTAGTDEHEPAPQLLALQVEVQLAISDGRRRILGADWPPRAPVPHDDVTSTVPTAGDDPFEVGVF